MKNACDINGSKAKKKQEDFLTFDNASLYPMFLMNNLQKGMWEKKVLICDILFIDYKVLLLFSVNEIYLNRQVRYGQQSN